MRARIQTIPTGGGGGGGGGGWGVKLLLEGGSYQFTSFSSGTGPSVSAHIRVSNSLNSHFIYFFFAGPGQFTKRLLIISADAKAKDSMILLKIKETAHINSGHVLLAHLSRRLRGELLVYQ